MIAKKKICTIAWYVDYNKLSHFLDTVVTDILEKIKAHFGYLTIPRGNKHSFLGVDITMANNGKVKM